jgi:hypothetical protein
MQRIRSCLIRKARHLSSDVLPHAPKFASEKIKHFVAVRVEHFTDAVIADSTDIRMIVKIYRPTRIAARHPRGSMPAGHRRALLNECRNILGQYHFAFVQICGDDTTVLKRCKRGCLFGHRRSKRWRSKVERERRRAAVHGLDKVSALFDNTNESGRPNQLRGKDEVLVAAIYRLFRRGGEPSL